MSTGRKRGRPKGTDIDDYYVLLRIADVLLANPRKSRTAAIRQLGIRNPSLIRRLRDKYTKREAALLSEAATNARSKKKAEAVSYPFVSTEQPIARDRSGKKRSTSANGSRALAPIGPVVALLQSEIKGPTVTMPAAEPAALSARGRRSAAMAEVSSDSNMGLSSGLNIETVVTQFVAEFLRGFGIDQKQINNLPVMALIRENARTVDHLLPLLVANIAGEQRAAAGAA
jgi:hypothetical protein